MEKLEIETKTQDVDHLDQEVEDYMRKFLDVSDEARNQDNAEKRMPLKEALATFPKAAMWAGIISLAVIMDLFDSSLISQFFAFPDFVKKFGEYYPDRDEYIVPVRWQTALTMSAPVGEIIGLFFAGMLADRFGYRKTLIGFLASVVCFIFIVFFAPNRETLLVGEILLGLPWGAFQTLTVSYASEVCPTVLRYYFTTWVNVCWGIGSVIATGVLKGLLNLTIENKYRIPFALQWIWPLPIAIGIYLAPESPWWLVKVGRYDEAKESLSRLLTQNQYLPDKEVLATAMVHKIKLTVMEEQAIIEGSKYSDCFKRRDFRRTRITCMTWLIQNLTGAAFMGNCTYFYEQAGLSTSNAFTFAVVQPCLGMASTIFSWYIVRKFGRRDLYFTGIVVQGTLLLIVGILGTTNSPGAAWAIGSLLLVITVVYDLGIGPICYCLVVELPSSHLRTKTVILARNAYNVAGVINSVITPYMLNPTAWNWQAKAGYLWAGISFLCALWTWFELPETKDRTFAELDLLFEKGISARKFKTTEVTVFEATETLQKVGNKGLADIAQITKNEAIHVEKV